MRKRILRDYVLVVTAALLCGFLIFYLVVSNIMMESTRRDLEYVLQTIRSIPVENLVEQKDDLSDSLRGDDSRLTIIDEDGTVLLDSDVRGDMENHLEREEVQMALSSADGMGYAVRDSTTMNMRMMYVALYSKGAACGLPDGHPLSGIRQLCDDAAAGGSYLLCGRTAHCHHPLAQIGPFGDPSAARDRQDHP
ncbi:MAG: hypothetical protein V8T10_03400 [Merdibacter sp.]